MKIFIHETLMVAKHSCKSIIEKLSKDLSRTQRLQQKDVSGEFLSAVDKLEYNKANELIDEALKEYLGSISVNIGLSNYLKKFGIYTDISDMYDSDIIKLIVDNKGKIDGVLRERGL